MEFPHLKDTQFPIIDNVNVYKYQNNFDYARWQGKVSFKLLNVLWNSNYADVPYFDDVESRDEWFDSKDGYVGTLESLFNNTPENTVKLPIPYNDAYNYNYLVVDMPIQTSVDNPINYEDSSIRVKRWFYFIEDMVQFSPNTTELQLSVDYWTTFIHSVEIPYLMLERGHAPMTKTTVEQFLANPIANNEYLLADDFDYGTDSVIQTSNYIPIGSGNKYVLFCVPYSQSDFALFGGSQYSGVSTPPTFSDTQERWGYQIQVDDYEWKYGSADYSNAQLPVHNMIQSGIMNGCECYAIEGQYARAFFNECAMYCVNFIHGIQAMFILDEALFTKTQTFTFRGYTLCNVDKRHIETNITLSKAQFGFDSKYENITKLYTFPYSQLEVTDDEGNSFVAKVENCGSLKMHTEVSLVYPFLNYNVFLSGINGNGTMSYRWMNVEDNYDDKTMWASDFSKFMMNWNIPTYSIYVSSESEFALNNFGNIQARRAGAIIEYENSVRFGNTTRENTADSFTTSTQNVADTQTGLMGNMQDTNDNADLKVDTYLDGGSVSQVGGSGGYLSDTYNANLNKLSNDADADLILMGQTYQLAQNMTVATATVNAAGQIGGGITNGAATGSAFGIPGAAIGAVAGGIASGVTAGMSCALALTDNANLYQNTRDQINAKFRSARDAMMGLTNAQKTYNGNCKDADNDLRTSTTTRFSGTNGVNNTNAVRTQNTETNNATWNRNANVVAEQNNLRQKQREAAYQYIDNRFRKPTEYSRYSGDFMNDVYQRRGVRLNIRTQTKSAIAQAGDAMLRFGYAIHRVWDMSQGFHYGKEFTFWKAEDIWINDGSGVANVATNSIGNILMKGVTVWRNPDHIGTVGIYDNF